MQRITIARSAGDIASLRSVWERLPGPTVFQTYAWNSTVAQVLGDRESPNVICVEDDNGTALIPAAINGDRRLTLIGESLADYRDVLVAGDGIAADVAWSEAARVGLQFSSGALRGDGDLSRWQGFQLHSFYGAPLVSRSEMSADRFIEQHNRLGRWRRRLERDGAAFRCSDGSNSALVRRIYEDKGGQPADAGDSLFSDPVRVEFMVQACAALGPACEIFTIESAGTLIASLVTFREPSVRRFYTIQFHQSWAKYSPGMVLIHQVTHASLRDGLDCDYMTGEQAYKMRFATSVVPMYWMEASAEALVSLGSRHALAA